MSDRPELKNWITTGNFITLGAMIVAGSVTWGTFTAAINAHAKTLEDHEIRIRSAERSIHEQRQEVITGLMDIKSEFGIVKTRLTAIEKAVLK